MVRGKVYLAHSKKWVDYTGPLPEVLFIRCSLGGRKRKRILSTYKKRGGLVFNSNIYNKRTVEKKVSGIKSVSDQVIKSRMIRSKSDVLAFLDRYQEAVFKPKNGRKGNGIFFVKKVKDRYRVYDYRVQGKGEKFLYTKREFLHYLTRVRANKGRYMAQRWIKFMKKNGRPFDMRVYVQKQDHKHWECTGIMTRIAGEGKKITNRSRGGRFVTAERLFTMYGPQKKRDLIRKVSAFAEEFGYALDKAFPNQHFADVGLDIGMDKNEDLHFMEVNFVAQYQTVRKHDRKMFNRLCWNPLIHASNYQGFTLKKRNDYEVKI
ncbi:YheC/YheD family protein [Alteribacter natronophilus]|uniref:YheC/YheD family protein n=1 Tax=Alteribacter natronophilus TaxID=2583810 RepID=UPI001FE9ACA2|nr:YheC/YheD family protein [Alteribacter natronophilus]